MPVDQPILIVSQGGGTIKSSLGVFVAMCWAGCGIGKNNPSMQEVHDIGPLPRGLYRVGPWEEMHPGLGPMVAHLEMVSGESFGRSGFYFHGPANDPAKYGQESHGCVVVAHAGREIVKSFAPEGSLIQVVG